MNGVHTNTEKKKEKTRWKHPDKQGKEHIETLKKEGKQT